MRVRTTLLALSLLACLNLFAQNNFWTAIPETAIIPEVFEKNYRPAVYKVFHLDEQALRSTLLAAPMEGSININNSPVIITIPNAQGGFENYKVVESVMMEPGLADKYPMIKTYLGIATDQSGSTVNFDLTPRGFHAQVLSLDRQTFYINTVDKNNGHHVVFDRNGMNTVTDFDCNTAELMNKSDVQNQAEGADDGLRRTFRLAVTVNGEYSQACLNGSETTDAQRLAKVLAMLTTNLNRANAIYNRDFGIRMNFITGMDVVLYLNPSTDPFNTSGSGWNSTTQVTLNTEIGSSNYDIGHFIAKVSFGNENGNAGCIGCVCKSSKGSAYTAHSAIQGDPLAVDYWCHEMGHQFGANHTFTYSTAGQVAEALIEPGSGSTIMGYAGITGSTDVQPAGDDYFHAKSIDQVTTYLKSPVGATCAVTNSTGNATPVVNAGADHIIPTSTPFVLEGQANDLNGDVLSYCWEQYDVFTSGSNTYPQATSTSGPVFRSMLYSTNLQRTFPALSTVLSGSTSSTWEAVPSVARTMKFRFTARDNAVSGAANNADDAVITVDGSAGPFFVSAPNNSVTPWKVGEFQTITWNVAGTAGGAINCANVAIDLSTDGGFTYPIILVANTPNDGSHEITVPNNITSSARIRVRAVGNVFFDISNSNFAIQASTAAQFAFSTPSDITACSGSPLTTTLNTASILGYSTSVNLTASGNPAGTTVVFSSNSVTPGNNVTVTLQGSVPVGTHVITVTGTSGSIVKTRTITFNVISASAAPALSTPADAALSQPITPSFSWTGISGTTSYKLDVSANPSFTGIVATASNLTTTSHTITSSLVPGTQYYWRVTASTVCGDLVSAARSFTTYTCGNVTSTDVPKTISASGTPTITSTINIAGSGIISDLDVIELKGNHSYVSDLEVKLASPAGTTVTLFDDICGSLNNFDLNLDDAAALTSFPCPPTGGVTVTPQGSLSSFNGQNVNGTWTLSIKDWFDEDGGSLNAWALKICLTSGSLPVTWLDFTARRNGEKAVLVQWSTASEVNNKLFEVQRSRDGVNFETIGSINAGNALTGVQQYLFNDMKPFAGVNYYRLKQIDVDGRSAFSSIARVMMPNGKTIYSINPNPATNKAIFAALTEMKKANIKLMDVSGKTVYTTYRTILNAGETIEIPVSRFAKGYYLVVIEFENGRFTEKLVVQ